MSDTLSTLGDNELEEKKRVSQEFADRMNESFNFVRHGK